MDTVSKLRRWARPEDVVFVIFFIASMILMMAYTGRVTVRLESVQHIVLGCILLLLIALMINFPSYARGGFRESRVFREGIGRSLRDYLPLLLVVLVYENMTHLFPLVVEELADPSLMEIDGTIFGMQPTIWMERITHPLLTDYLTFAYLLYFFMPALPALVFSVSGRRGDFRDLMLTICLSLYIAYIGYMLVPAIGPKYYMPENYSVDLQGIFLYQRVEPVWDMMRSTTRDCFPSHHTAMSLISFYYIRRLRDHSRASRWVYYAYIPLTMSIVFSTVYLRYHWVIDVAAGFVLAGISIWIANRLNRTWSRKVAPLPVNRPGISKKDELLIQPCTENDINRCQGVKCGVLK